MLSISEIKRLAGQFHTNELNVAREYAQHIFLSYLYADPAADALLFKGGTALRIVYQSPRFSEDLDFTACLPFYKTKTLIERTAIKVRQEIDGFRLLESKPTSGGYFGVMRAPVGPWRIEVLVQASARQKALKGEAVLVTTRLAPSYGVIALPEAALVSEKIAALLSRRKPRDFYDLYFILRKPMGDKKAIAARRPEILEKLDQADQKILYNELKVFLPKSHWAIIQRLPDQLKRELGRL